MVPEGPSKQGTRSPIELLWTAKNNDEHTDDDTDVDIDDDDCKYDIDSDDFMRPQ